MKRVLRFSFAGLALITLLGGCATPKSGPAYFLKTASDAIVFVDPAAPSSFLTNLTQNINTVTVRMEMSIIAMDVVGRCKIFSKTRTGVI